MKLVYLANLAPTRSKTPLITEAERKTLLQILEGGKNGAHFKKITENIWSARLTKQARFLVLLARVTIVLEKFSSHKDYTEKLKNKNLCQHYLGHLSAEQIQAIFSEDAPQSQDAEFTPEELIKLKEAFSQTPEEVYFSLGGKLVALSAQQEACTKPYVKTGNTPTTCIIQGGPGTGKTLVLINSFEKAYLGATQEETKHSSEAFHQFIYLTTTSTLSAAIGAHLETILPKRSQPFLSMSYQDFACMVDPTLNPNPEKPDPTKPKCIVGIEHFLSWCAQNKLYTINPDSQECHQAFYKKLYKEFRIISGCDTLAAYKQLGVCESSFPKDLQLRETLYKLYTDYTQKYVDLNFYDLTEAIRIYKEQQSDFFTPKLFVDETQNLSRRQILNLIEYAKAPENIKIASDLNQRVYDAVPNVEFIQSYWRNQKVNVDHHILSNYYRVPKAVAKTLNTLSRLIEAFNQGLDCKTPAFITCAENADLGDISQTLYSQFKDQIAEHYKALSARPNCIVVVGDPVLLTEAQSTFDNTDFIYTLDGTKDGIIGLEADYIIGYKILKGFSQEELALFLPFFKANTFCSHKPKDKNDKSKQTLVLKLHQLYVGLSRPLKEFIFIVNDHIESKPSTKKHRTHSKNPELLFMSQLLTTEEPKAQEKPTEALTSPIAKEALHKEWVEACRTTILYAQDYERAKAICARHTITPEELNLSEMQRIEIPQGYHSFFFKFESVCGQVSKKPEIDTGSKSQPASNTKRRTDAIKINYAENMMSFVIKLQENFSEKNIEKLLEYSYHTIYTALFETHINGNNIWNNINETQKQTVYKVFSKDSKHDNITKFIRIFETHPKVLCDFGEYLTSLNIQINKIYAFTLYEAANKQNFPYAQFKLGVCYHLGLGKSIDLKQAVAFYRKAYLQEPYASAALAYCYENGLGGLKIFPVFAASLYKRAAKKDAEIPKKIQALFGIPNQTIIHQESKAQVESKINHENVKTFINTLFNSFDNPLKLETYIHKLFSYSSTVIKTALFEITFENGKNFWDSINPAQENLILYSILNKKISHELIGKLIAVFRKYPKVLYNFATYRQNLNHTAVQETDMFNFQLYEAASYENLAAAQYALSTLHSTGGVVPQDMHQSFQWLRMAAKQKYAMAQNGLGTFYEQGLAGLPVNIGKAQKYFTLASQAGVLLAHFNLGLLYEKKIHVDTCQYPIQKAITLFTLASEQKYGPAQLELGLIYDYGIDQIKQDHLLAVEFYEKAIENGSFKAYNELARCYETGRGVAKNTVRAAQLYLAGCKHNEPFSIYNLARCFEMGIGLKKDLVEAKKCYHLAVQHGYRYNPMIPCSPLAKPIIGCSTDNTPKKR